MPTWHRIVCQVAIFQEAGEKNPRSSFSAIAKLPDFRKPPEPKPPVQQVQPRKEQAPAKKKVVRAYSRQVIFQAKTLQSEADIDAYVEKIRFQLKQLLKNCDEIKLN